MSATLDFGLVGYHDNKEPFRVRLDSDALDALIADGAVEIGVRVVAFPLVAADEGILAAGRPVEAVRANQTLDVVVRGRAVDEIVVVCWHVVSFLGAWLSTRAFQR